VSAARCAVEWRHSRLPVRFRGSACASLAVAGGRHHTALFCCCLCAPTTPPCIAVVQLIGGLGGGLLCSCVLPSHTCLLWWCCARGRLVASCDFLARAHRGTHGHSVARVPARPGCGAKQVHASVVMRSVAQGHVRLLQRWPCQCQVRASCLGVCVAWVDAGRVVAQAILGCARCVRECSGLQAALPSCDMLCAAPAMQPRNGCVRCGCVCGDLAQCARACVHTISLAAATACVQRAVLCVGQQFTCIGCAAASNCRAASRRAS
jgi:hypothetical protein